MRITYTTACIDTFGAHYRDRCMFQREFCRRVLAEPALKGEVLDVGCGGNLPSGLEPLRVVMTHVDGVDPHPSIMQHPLLRRRWQGEFENADIPAGKYDLVYAYNVVEHVAAAEPFFRQIRRVLKPGGTFWALTPHAQHPFSMCVKLVQSLGLKHGIARRTKAVNDYPAYYRLNTAEAVTRAATACGFESAEFVYIPCVQWDSYFPNAFRILPNLFDAALGIRFRPFMQLLAYRLQ